MLVKNPKFSLDLTINELINIPQTSGSCFIELQIKDSPYKSTVLHKHQPQKDSDELFKESKRTITNNVETNSTSSKKVRATTSKKKVHNFKCTFHYKLSCNLKFPINKRQRAIDDKYLLLSVYYSSSSDERHTTLLGRAEVNLSEYIEYDDPVTSKILLRHSKVNSILNLKIFLRELPDNFDFHTQLQIQDSTQNISQKGTSLANDSTLKSIDHKKTFKHLIEERKSRNTLEVFSSSQSPDRADSQKPRSKQQTVLHAQESPLWTFLSSIPTNNTKYQQPQQLMMLNLAVSNLSRKLLESNWEPDLQGLLEYTPEKCINDVFSHSSDGKEWDKKLSEIYSIDHPDDDTSSMNGLIDEANYRSDLRSWSIGNH